MNFEQLALGYIMRSFMSYLINSIMHKICLTLMPAFSNLTKFHFCVARRQLPLRGSGPNNADYFHISTRIRMCILRTVLMSVRGSRPGALGKAQASLFLFPS